MLIGHLYIFSLVRLFFKIRLLVFLMSTFKGSLYTLSDLFLQVITSSLQFVFSLSECVFQRRIFNFNEIQLKVIYFMDSDLGVISKNSLPHFFFFKQG